MPPEMLTARLQELVSGMREIVATGADVEGSAAQQRLRSLVTCFVQVCRAPGQYRSVYTKHAVKPAQFTL